MESLDDKRRDAGDRPVNLVLGPGEFGTTIAPEEVRGGDLTDVRKDLPLAVIEARPAFINPHDFAAAMQIAQAGIDDAGFGWWGRKARVEPPISAWPRRSRAWNTRRRKGTAIRPIKRATYIAIRATHPNTHVDQEAQLSAGPGVVEVGFVVVFPSVAAPDLSARASHLVEFSIACVQFSPCWFVRPYHFADPVDPFVAPVIVRGRDGDVKRELTSAG